MKKKLATCVLAGIAIVGGIVTAVLWPGRPYDWRLPDNMPPPRVPQDNPMTQAKVELGRYLFYDQRLSVNGNLSCGGCHRQQLAFTDGLAQAIGSTGQPHPRSAMSLVNAAYASRLGWANHLLDRLEMQALTPLLGEEPVEMGMGGHEAEIVALLQEDGRYKTLFPAAFPRDANPYSLLNVIRAIAAFTRSIVSFESDYDRYLRGDTAAMSDSAVRGLELFFSERLECFHCHGGFNFTDSSTHASAVVDSFGFHNTGLYNLAGSGAYPPENTGLYDLTGERRDMGRFKAPGLRNVALTAPYMHDGSVATLDDVLDHYARGGRSIADGQYAGDGRLNPYRSPFVRGFELSETERADVLTFLHALTDTNVTSNKRWADPYLDETK